MTVRTLDVAYAVLGVCVLGLLLIGPVWILRRRAALPGSLKTFDELESIRWVVSAVLRTLDANDPRRTTMYWLTMRLGVPLGIPYGAFLRADEIATLAPFIDQWLAGAFPHFLAAEYDYSDVALEKFKARMKQNGMWPA